MVEPETDGLDATLERGRARPRRPPGIRAVYSIGGGNAAILDAFGEPGECRVFVAHDLDADNTRAAARPAGLRGPAPRPVGRHAARLPLMMQAHGALAGTPQTLPSQIQVMTPYNEPVVDWEPDTAG